MTRLVVFAALLGLTLANLTGFNGPKGVSKRDFAGISSKPFALRATCTSLEIDCDGGCIPSGSECCSSGDGSYCDSGTYCTSGGCCEDGEICSGTASGCDDGRQLCGKYCVPEDAVCCLDGSFCDSGQTCSGDGSCETGSGGSGSGGSSGDSSDDDEPSETIVSQPTATSASGDDDSGKTLCTRKSRGGSSDGDGDSDESSDGGDDGCGGDNSGSSLAPSLGGVLLAVFIFMTFH